MSGLNYASMNTKPRTAFTACVLAAAVAAVLGATTSAEGVAPEPEPRLKIVKSASCAYPEHRSIMTLEPDGKAELWFSEGFEPRGGRTVRNYKQLTPKDMSDLKREIRKSDYLSIPDSVHDPIGDRRIHSDPCSVFLEISLDETTKKIHYSTGYDSPPNLDRLVKTINDILDRHPWAEKAP